LAKYNTEIQSLKEKIQGNEESGRAYQKAKEDARDQRDKLNQELTKMT
jgi:hypothetical protein